MQRCDADRSGDTGRRRGPIRVHKPAQEIEMATQGSEVDGAQAVICSRIDVQAKAEQPTSRL